MTPLEQLLAVVDRLLDPDVMQPYISAWEFEINVDAEDLHAELRAARAAVAE